MGTAYVHCAGCRRAFDAAAAARCPACRRRIGPASLEDRVADAIEEIERALDEATDAERASLLGMLRGKMKRALPAVTTLVEVAPRLVASRPRPDWRAVASSVMGGLARRVRAALA